jgi:fructose-1,6-bisphosphatase I
MVDSSKTTAQGITLAQHISHQQVLLRATGEFSAVLTQISLAGKVIARALKKGGLFDREEIGSRPLDPVSEAKRIDNYAKETFVKIFTKSPWITTLMLSEDLETGGKLREGAHGGKYVVYVDALDGAPNLTVNGIVGSIFGVYRRLGSEETTSSKDLLQKGAEQVAAGYIMYGPSTVLVYSAGYGVNAYTLDTGIGEFLATQQNIHIPERGLTYSCNEANCHEWHEHLRRYIDHLRKRDPKSDKYYSSRYSGSLIPDLHRTLLEGGVYICPANMRNPDRPQGKRLLMYECNPLAFVAEQAGGRCTTGTERMLKVQPSELGHRTQLVIGSPYEVLLYEDFLSGKR